MKDGFIKLDDEDGPNKGGNDKHGILPDGEYGAADTKIFYCCNDAGDWKQSIELPIHEPFFLLPYQSKNCQRVKGALSKLETITYDTEENNNHDDFKRSHTFTDGQKGKPTLYYCYYKGMFLNSNLALVLQDGELFFFILNFLACLSTPFILNRILRFILNLLIRETDPNLVITLINI